MRDIVGCRQSGAGPSAFAVGMLRVACERDPHSASGNFIAVRTLARKESQFIGVEKKGYVISTQLL